MAPTNTKYPTFSIITVTLNHYDGLINTHKSLITQDFINYEWVVIDGKSDDNSVQWLQNLRSEAQKSGLSFQFSSEKDRGIYDAMNKGIDLARGRYLIFMNAGDTFAHKRVLSDLSTFCGKSPDFIYADALEPQISQKKHNKAHYKTARIPQTIAWGMFTHHQAMVYSRFKIREHKLRYSLLYKIASDYDFTIRFLKKAQKYSYYNKEMCVFEQGGISQQQAQLGRYEQFLIRDLQLGISRQKNVMIYAIQSLAWFCNRYTPWLYVLARHCARKYFRTSNV